MKKHFPGLDVLKFALSFFIVAIHTSLFQDIDILANITKHLNLCAVPTFFAISSFIFFKKNNGIFETTKIFHFAKRLIILMIVWEIILFPITYEVVYRQANLVGILYHVIVCGTFASSWFFRALLFGTIIVYLIPKSKRVMSFLVFSFLFLVWEAFKSQIMNVTGINFYFTFLPHLYAVNLGALLAGNSSLLSLSKNTYISFACFLYALSFIPNFCPFLRLLIPFSLIPLFVNKKVKNEIFCKRIRSMSILVYILHFAFIYILGKYCSVLCGIYFIDTILYYLIILSVSLLASYFILKVEEKLPALRYLH